MIRFLLFIASVCVIFWTASFWVDTDDISSRVMNTSAELASKVTERVSEAIKETKDKVETAKNQAVDEKKELGSKEVASRIEEAVEKELRTSVGSTARKAEDEPETVHIEDMFAHEDSEEAVDLGFGPGELDAARILAEIDGLLNP